mmetsp:Transcript_14190/g.56566  ORF Transcript_14190/g.56566 Transcript_14190/m.56566 type:complete len:204 (-) Transcript_14190:230-841(-)
MRPARSTVAADVMGPRPRGGCSMGASPPDSSVEVSTRPSGCRTVRVVVVTRRPSRITVVVDTDDDVKDEDPPKSSAVKLLWVANPPAPPPPNGARRAFANAANGLPKPPPNGSSSSSSKNGCPRPAPKNGSLRARRANVVRGGGTPAVRDGRLAAVSSKKTEPAPPKTLAKRSNGSKPMSGCTSAGAASYARRFSGSDLRDTV